MFAFLKSGQKINCLLFSLIIFVFPLAGQENLNPDPTRFQAEIDQFLAWDQKNAFPINPVLFAGSSSIRMWQTARAFPNLPVINRGFGGAHISDILHYFQETVGKYHPKKIIFYCGDNDIASGKAPENVVEDFRQFLGRTWTINPKIQIIYLPIKPSLNRWNLWSEMKMVNSAIKSIAANEERLKYADIATPMLNEKGEPDFSFFLNDGLHLNESGYLIWKNVLSGFLVP